MIRPTAFFLALTLVPSALFAEARALRPDDLYALRDLGDPQLSPDGRWVAYTVTSLDKKDDTSDTDVWMVPFAGGDALRLTTSKKSESRPRFSPDGKWLAFLSGREGKKKQVWLMNRAGGEAEKLTDYKASVSDLEWSPDSTRLALVVSDVDPNDPDVDADDATATGADAAKKKDKPKTEPPIVIRRRQFKRDTEGYLRDIRDHVHVFDVQKKTSVQLTSGQYDDSEPTWSPDGQWIAFTANRTDDPDANQDTDVFLVAAKGGTPPRALAKSPGRDESPRFSPDGQWVAFVAGGDPKDMWYGANHLALARVSDGSVKDLTSALDRNVGRPRFSADGRSVLFLLEDGGNAPLARVSVAGGPVERVVSGELVIDRFALGPKGEIAVLTSDTQHPSEVKAVVPGAALRALTHANDELLKGIKLGSVERFKFKGAAGDMVDGFLTHPPDAPLGTKLPAILRLHGGPVSQFQTEFDFEWQVLAAQGYAVIAANPHGSSGYGTKFSRALWADWGNKDFDDVMAAVDHVVAMGVADPDRLGVGGWSYGGILTDYVITKTGRFKAAVSGASEANYLANYGTDHYQYEWETELGLPWKNTELWIKLSPWFNVEKVTTPTLVMGGASDMNVPLLNSEQLYQALRRLGKETELVIYPDQNHGLVVPSYRVDRLERYVDWYGRFLKPGGAAVAAGAR